MNCDSAWDEQRQFNDLAIEALEDHPLAVTIRQELEELTPSEPQPAKTGFQPVSAGTPLKCGGAVLGFDGAGSLVQLQDSTGAAWADASHAMGEFLYNTMTEADYSADKHLCNNVLGSKPGSSARMRFSRVSSFDRM